MDLNNFSEKLFNNYEEAVEHFAINKENEVLSNSGPDHAVIIFKNIFRTAENEISLYANDIFSQENPITTDFAYMNAMKSFLEKKDTRLRIILRNYNEATSNNPLRDLIRTYSAEKVIFRVNKDNDVCIGDQKVHFCLADGRMYRMEYATEERKARCNFNDPDSVRKYQVIFNQLFQSSETANL